MTCEWCGHDHAVTQLCSKRPKWSRRGFVALLGAAAIGAMLPTPPLAFRADALALAVSPLGNQLRVGDVFTISGHYATNPPKRLQQFVVTNFGENAIDIRSYQRIRGN